MVNFNVGDKLKLNENIFVEVIEVFGDSREYRYTVLNQKTGDRGYPFIDMVDRFTKVTDEEYFRYLLL